MPQDYTELVAAMSLPEAAAYTVQRFNLPESANDVRREWNAMLTQAYRSSVELKSYSRQYLELLKNNGVKLAIATSLSVELYQPVLERHGIGTLFDAILSTDSIARGKRFPDIFVLAAQKLGVNPQQCVVFDDLFEAILSAKQAKMRTVAVYDQSSKNRWDMTAKSADAAIYSFREAPLPNNLTWEQAWAS